MTRFSAHVVLMHPMSGEVTGFAPGDEVPEWATVGAHVTDGGPSAPAAAGPGPDPADETPVAAGDYSEWTVAELRDEIATRNEDRTKANQLPSKGPKDDLIVALTADDA